MYIPPGEIRSVSCGVSVSLPAGVYGRIASRSSSALNGLTAEAGVIDPDYDGPIKTVLRNNSTDAPTIVKRGDNVAQLVLEKYLVTNLTPLFGQRTGGFGSTDV